MNFIRTVSSGLTLVAALGILLPGAAFAEVTVAKRPLARDMDISLQDGGILVGQVVNPQGAAKEGVEVSVFHKEKELIRAKTNKQGRFAVKGLSGGSYTLATSQGRIPIRAWTKRTAPPSSALGALLVEGTTVRAQCNCAPIGSSVDHSQPSYIVEASPVAGNAEVVADTGFNENAASFNQGGSAFHDGGVSYSPGGASFNQGGTSNGATYVDGSSSYYDASGSHAGHGHYHGAASGGGGGGGLLGFGILGGGGGAAGLMSSPWIVGGVVAAAIAIPVALDDDDAS